MTTRSCSSSKQRLLIFLAISSAFVVDDAVDATYSENDDEATSVPTKFFERLRELLLRQPPELRLNRNEIWERRPIKIGAISWNNCGPSEDVLQIKKLDFSANVLKFPENVSVSYLVDLQEDEVAPVRVDLTIDRKFGLLWVKVGSVVFNDFCQLLPSLPLNPPLVCPFKKGRYEDSGLHILLPAVTLPEYMISGKYWFKADLTDRNGKHMGCVAIYVKLE